MDEFAKPVHPERVETTGKRCGRLARTTSFSQGKSMASTSFAGDLSERYLPKIFAVKDGVGFTRDYQDKNITVEGVLRLPWSPTDKKLVLFLVDKTLNQHYLFFCDISSENSAQYDQLRTGDLVTMQGVISAAHSEKSNDKGGHVLVLGLKNDCSITRK